MSIFVPIIFDHHRRISDYLFDNQSQLSYESETKHILVRPSLFDTLWCRVLLGDKTDVRRLGLNQSRSILLRASCGPCRRIFISFPNFFPKLLLFVPRFFSFKFHLTREKCCKTLSISFVFLLQYHLNEFLRILLRRFVVYL